MTRVLSICLRNVQFDDELEKRFEQNVSEQCLEEKFRIVVSQEKDSAAVEPYIGSASLSALLSVGKKLSTVELVISALVTESFKVTDDVRIAHLLSGETRPKVEDVTLADALLRVAGKSAFEAQIVPPYREFVFSRVEAKMLAPLVLDSGQVATHFLRDYSVVAPKQTDALTAIIEDLSKEGAVYLTYDTCEVVKVHISDGLDETSIAGKSGRVFFSD